MPMGLKEQGNAVLSPMEEREIEALTAQAQLSLDGVASCAECLGP